MADFVAFTDAEHSPFREVFRVCSPCWKMMQDAGHSSGCLWCRIQNLEYQLSERLRAASELGAQCAMMRAALATVMEYVDNMPCYTTVDPITRKVCKGDDFLPFSVWEEARAALALDAGKALLDRHQANEKLIKEMAVACDPVRVMELEAENARNQKLAAQCAKLRAVAEAAKQWRVACNASSAVVTERERTLCSALDALEEKA